MPGRNRTGPEGAGPRTGWGMGDCGSDQPRTAQPRFARFGPWGRRGRGRGFGRGWGFRGAPRRGWRGEASMPAWQGPEDEAEVLRDEAELLQTQLDVVKRRLAKLEEDAQA